KIPRWPSDKFRDVDRTIGTQMKSTGEVMAIGRTFEESLMKAIRSLDIGIDCLRGYGERDKEKIKANLITPSDQRLFYIADAINSGFSIEEISELTKINPFFLEKMRNIIDASREIAI
ncbi:MAG TPA: carbamoyl-phosphate synthase subunit L, partial [Candidatus Altiarchaeales archaeon]|nr:carbamoyl-phosphate synthase subunit L [Candidatus Altiarchaeales archaeon]